MNTVPTVVAQGKHLRLMRVGTWEYVERANISGIVGIIAVTDDGKLLLVEQYRPPVGKNVIELPAGLAGDVRGQEDEGLLAAARRELLEETGYEAAEMILLPSGPVSAGLSTEVVTMVRATKLRKVASGGGDASERITVHEVPLAEVVSLLGQMEASGRLVDLKVYVGLYFARGN